MEDTPKETVFSQKTLVPISLVFAMVATFASLLIGIGIYANTINEQGDKIKELEIKIDQVPSRADYTYLSKSIDEIKDSLKQIVSELTAYNKN